VLTSSEPFLICSQVAPKKFSVNPAHWKSKKNDPEHVLRYLARYTHRVAISNHRLVSFADRRVTFRWRDSAHNNEQQLLTLTLDEFLRRFL